MFIILTNIKGNHLPNTRQSGMIWKIWWTLWVANVCTLFFFLPSKAQQDIENRRERKKNNNRGTTKRTAVQITISLAKVHLNCNEMMYRKKTTTRTIHNNKNKWRDVIYYYYWLPFMKTKLKWMDEELNKPGPGKKKRSTTYSYLPISFCCFVFGWEPNKLLVDNKSCTEMLLD